jgi:uncharacterized protein YkwD
MALARAAARRIRSLVLGSALLVISIAASVGLRPAPAGAQTQPRLAERLLTMTNAARERHGLRPLSMRSTLARYATRHTERMASQDSLFHSTSTQMADVLAGDGWSMWGENIGMAPTLSRVQRSFLASPEHRANILRRAFDHAGIGVVRSRGVTWVTVDFYAS